MLEQKYLQDKTHIISRDCPSALRIKYTWIMHYKSMELISAGLVQCVAEFGLRMRMWSEKNLWPNVAPFVTYLNLSHGTFFRSIQIIPFFFCILALYVCGQYIHQICRPINSVILYVVYHRFIFLFFNSDTFYIDGIHFFLNIFLGLFERRDMFKQTSNICNWLSRIQHKFLEPEMGKPICLLTDILFLLFIFFSCVFLR